MKKPIILIVDDEPVNLSELNQLLKPSFQVRGCKSGEQALSAAATEPRPDLILLDVMMPDMNGYTVLYQLKEDETTRGTPVIFVSALNEAVDEEHGLQLGAVDYIIKPVKPAIMLARVRAQLEIKQAEEQLKASLEEKEGLLKQLLVSRNSFNSIVEKDITGIIVTSKSGIICFANPAARRMFNRANNELVGEQFGIPITPADGAIEFDIIRKGGMVGTGELQATDTEWEGQGANLLLIRDITESKLYEESLIQTSEELRRIDELKSEFISVASHELRTPLTSIKNAVDIIYKGKTGAITAAQEKFLSMAQRNINRLSTLINDMLDIAKIESGKNMQYKYAPINAGEIIDSVFNTLLPLANEKFITLTRNILSEQPIISGDAGKIEQVLINLVGNAIKFTPNQGMITIATRHRQALAGLPENALGYLSISIADTGIGISETDKERLFEKFYQASHSLTKQEHSGTGLGLAICKGIVEGHQGKIWCESVADMGSTFHFALPVTGLQEQDTTLLESALQQAKKDAEQLSVLVIRARDLADLKKACAEIETDKVFASVKEKILSGGIKSTDKIAVSLPDNEIMLILPGTNKAGAETVQKRVMYYAIGNGVAGTVADFFIAFVATYPEDGISSEELIKFAKKNSGHEDDDGETNPQQFPLSPKPQ